jgi:lipoate-protein ligase A
MELDVVNGWAIEELSGAPGELHARPFADSPGRRVWVFTPTRPALVLGSTQRSEVVDHDRARREGVEVVRRSTGGGAVLVDPDTTTWIDVVLPSDDPLWESDISASSLWLGGTWVAALHQLGIDEAKVHGSAMCHTKLSRLICFAGLGPGEVSIAESKVVGIAQRRARAGARFQSAVLGEWDRERWAGLLRPGLEAYGDGWHAELDRVDVTTVDRDPSVVAEALLRCLPQPATGAG